MSSVEPHTTGRPGLTVVIPTHGGRPSVLTAVEALLANAHSNDIEVLVVSDGEAKTTRELLSGVHDARLTILEQAKSGAAAARNRGLHAAKFDWVAFVDDDDVPRPNWLQVWRHGAATYAVAITAAVAYWREGRLDGQRACRLEPNNPTMSASTLLAGAFWIKTDLVRAVKGYDPALRMSENQDLGLRICDLLMETDKASVVEATDDVVIDLFVQETKRRSFRYGTAPSESARLFLRRYAHRLETDPRHKASLLRIIARDDRLAGRYPEARKTSCLAVRTDPFNLQNLRSLGLACLARFNPSRPSAPAQ